jgi:hypothetical protein
MGESWRPVTGAVGRVPTVARCRSPRLQHTGGVPPRRQGRGALGPLRRTLHQVAVTPRAIPPIRGFAPARRVPTCVERIEQARVRRILPDACCVDPDRVRAHGQVLVQVATDPVDQVRIGIFQRRLDPHFNLVGWPLVTQALKMLAVVDDESYFDVCSLSRAGDFRECRFRLVVMNGHQLQENHVVSTSSPMARLRAPRRLTPR